MIAAERIPRWILTVLLGLGFTWPGFAAEISDTRKKELVLGILNGGLPSPAVLVEDEANYLKEFVRQRRKEVGWDIHTRVLIYLGDEEEIAKVMSAYPELDPKLGSIFPVGQPRMIEYIAPVLFREEPSRAPNAVQTAASLAPDFAGLHIVDTLGRSWEVPQEVRVWAQQIMLRSEKSGPALNGSILAIVKAWWEENGSNVKARRWAELKPGGRLPVVEHKSVATTRTPPPLPENAPAPTPVNGGLGNLRPAVRAEEEGGELRFILMGVGGLALLCLGIVVARGRGERSRR
jgi:hypothetical protein